MVGYSNDRSMRADASHRSTKLVSLGVAFLIAALAAVLLAPSSAPAASLNAPVVGIARTADGQGYWLVAADGGVFGLGDAPFYGAMAGAHLNAPVVGMAATPDGKGYWLVGADGGVFGFGDAQFHGSMAGAHLNAPVVGMAATPDGQGYWLVGADGGVYAFGDAPFRGSEGGTALNAPVVGMAATPDGQGYWLVGADGGVFALGDAPYRGSEAGTALNKPVVAIAAVPDGQGYWLTAGDGGVFSFGDAQAYGSLGGAALNAPVVGIAASRDGKGYWLAAADGGVFSFGDSVFHSSLPSLGLTPAPVSPVPSAPPPIPGGSSLSSIRQQVVDVALSQEGYNPVRDGCSRYSALVCQGQIAYREWCSIFATWTWESAGVPIPIYPYSGDPFRWASAHAYVLDPKAAPAPGDLVFFGSGPGSSVHVAIVTQVLPDGAIVTMNGNDGQDAVGPSTFFPPRESGLPPVYGYASPVMDGGATAHIASGRAARTATTTVSGTLALTPDQLKRLLSRQDPPSYKRALRRAARAHPAFEHMPFKGRKITIEIANYLHSGRIVIDVLYRTSRHGAVGDFGRFLRRHHDSGRAYIVHYHHERKARHGR